MAHSYHHAVSSVRKWGGTPDDFLPIHNWMDGSKLILADFRHRALRHHCEGIFLAETIFGTTLTLSTGRVVSGAADRRAARSRGSGSHPIIRGLGTLYPPRALDGTGRGHRDRCWRHAAIRG
jgi:hypothetical protein